MSQIDRTEGLVGNTAIKAPVKAGTLAAITLSGQQTIDGVAVVTGDRVLVKAQSDQTTNGIYTVDTGDWTRSDDFDGNLDVANGTLVLITEGSTLAGSMWKVSATDPVTIGSSNITFVQGLFSDIANVLFLQAGTGAVSRSAQNKMRDIISVKDFGATGDGTTDDTTAIQAALDSAAGSAIVYFPYGVYKVTSTLYIKHSWTTIEGGNSGINYTGSGYFIDFQLEGGGSAYPQRVSMRDFSLGIVAAGASAFNWRSTYSLCDGIQVNLQASNQNGWRLNESGTDHTGVYYSQWRNCHVIGSVNGTTITNQTGWVFTNAGTPAIYGPNGNTFIGGNVTGCSICWSVLGLGNTFIGLVVQPADLGTGIAVSTAGSTPGEGCDSNTFINTYLEGGNNTNSITIGANCAATTFLGVFATGFSGGSNLPTSDSGTGTVWMPSGNGTAHGPYYPGYRFANINPPGGDTTTMGWYQVGTLTPVLKFGGSATGITGTLTGSYTRRGDRVEFTIKIALTSKGVQTGAATIDHGFPWAPAEDTPVHLYCQSMSVGTVDHPQGVISSGASTITLSDFAAGVSTAMDDTNFTDTTVLILSGTARVA